MELESISASDAIQFRSGGSEAAVLRDQMPIQKFQMVYVEGIKPLLDRVLAAALLALLSPLMLAIAFLIQLESNGPALFFQERFGRHGRPFRLLKFRSMVVNAEQQGPYFTAPGDPRVTPLGRFLRKTSLDELPQLINILRGEMSFVGPRPDVAAQRSNYSDEEFAKRHAVSPGITGLAQSRIRHDATVRSRKKYDLFYSDRVSPLLDLKIMLWTVAILRRGSY